jgi:hypothetical protein
MAQKLCGKERFFGIPYNMLQSPNYIRLSGNAIKLLVDLGMQYNGSNNGDLCATWSMMKERGWKSKSTLYHSIQELVHYGLIFKSSQGGRHKPTLYCLTWKNVNLCDGKLDINPTNAPLAYWVEQKADF